jgi:hypothetical protein
MEPKRRAFLARNANTKSHFLFTVIPAGCNPVRHETLDIEVINELVLWKNAGEMVALAEKTGPLVSTDLHGEASRLVTIQEAVNIATASFGEPDRRYFCHNDPASLREQLFLDGRSNPLPSKASTDRAALAHGLFEGGAEDLHAWASSDPDAMVAIEPVTDVVFARNLCSIALRVIANYQKPDVEDVLEASGFHRSEAEDGPGGRLVIPIHRVAVDDTTLEFSWGRGERMSGYMLGDPLARALERPEAGAGVTIGWDCGQKEAMTWLTARADIPQREAASQMLCALFSSVRSLRCEDGAFLGWDFPSSVDLAVNGLPSPLFRSLFAAMVGTVVYRNGKAVATCRNCGCAFFVRPKGKRREFCTLSCRSQFFNAKSANLAKQKPLSVRTSFEHEKGNRNRKIPTGSPGQE